MTRLDRSTHIAIMAAAVLVAGLLLGPLARAGAQPASAGSSWKSMIAPLKAKIAAHPDPETRVPARDGLRSRGDADRRLAHPEADRPGDWRAEPPSRTGGADHRRCHGGDPARSARSSGPVRAGVCDLGGRQHHHAVPAVSRDHAPGPDERDEPRYLGYIYSTHNDAKNTIAQWEESVRLDPSNSVLHYMLGSAYYRTGRTRDAAIQFSLAYRTAPSTTTLPAAKT